jgi:hypothetical protein
MRNKFIACFSGLCLLISAGQTQDLVKPLKQNLKFVLNPLGDSHIDVSMNLDAAQWDNYKKILGNNSAILKRQMERALPGYFLQNFNYKEDDMNRGYTLSFDALGMSKINANGQWQIDLDMKNPDVTKLSDKNFAITSTLEQQGTLIQQVSNITFPDGASDVKQDKDAFDKAIFLYSLSPSMGTSGWGIVILGLCLLVAGVFLLRGSSTSTPKPK